MKRLSQADVLEHLAPVASIVLGSGGTLETCGLLVGGGSLEAISTPGSRLASLICGLALKVNSVACS